MYPYQLSKVLAEQRVHDMITAAEDALVTEARRHRKSLATPSAIGWLAKVIARLVALVHLRTPAAPRGSGAALTKASASAAGPMGCAA
jgi:hypothetical protein